MRYIVKKENAETIYISGGIFVSNGKWTHPKMILDDYELVIVLKGRFQMRIGQARKEFLEGDCFILFPGEEHIGIEAAWDVSFYWLHFRIRDVEVLEGERRLFPLLERMSGDGSDGLIFNECCRPSDRTQLVVLINQLLYYQSVYKRTSAPIRPCDICMELVLYELAQVTREINLEKLRARSPDAGTMMDKIYDYIRANCYKNLQVAEVARQFGYNSQYFIRMFRRKTGISPKQYIIHQQIRQAKYLFSTTSLKVTEVAEQVGMSNARVFRKRFRKSEGISPSEYRRAFHKTHYNSR